VVLVDLATGATETVAETAGWDTQTGAHVQWGGDDSELFFNDLDTETWTPHGVRLNPKTGERTELDGTVYHVSPDGSRVASPDLLGTRATQDGYGAVVPDEAVPEHDGAPDDDGVYVTDVESGEAELVASLGEMVRELDIDLSETFGPGDFYGFHVAWSPDGERLLFALRYWPEGAEFPGWKPQLVPMRADGSDLALAVPAEVWERGGHHVRWGPDGEQVTMNLRFAADEPLRFASVAPDGSDRSPLSTEVAGSGHPSLHPDGRTIVTDAYLHEEDFAFGDGTVPIRLVDVAAGTEQTALRIPSKPDYTGPRHLLRVDPHPAWGPSGRFVVYNACPDGKRRVFIADVGEFVGE
jgi:Tol biopolymer transport system component